MEVFVRAITLVSRLCGVAAALLIAAAVVVVCHMVFVRAVLNDNTIWQTDFTTYSLIAATFIGSPYLLLNRGHVNVDVLPLYLGRRGRFGLALAATLMSLGFCVTMTILACQFWHEAWANAWVSDTMWRVRLWIPYAAMPVGLGVLTLQYVASLYNLVTGREPPFGLDPKAGPHAAPNAAPNAAPERAPGEAA
ncbi:MAG: TRAP transporter small permease [Xanthobacteraceae bacterium]|nr:TRAP transporter small permease [Xanthobacteraceae bacterium]